MSHYFDDEPDIASDPTTIDVVVGDLAFVMDTDRGVFSHGHLDAGTALLLRNAPPPPQHGNLVDIGCGAGPITLALALRAPDATIWAVDPNARARSLTERNAARLGLNNVRVADPDDIPHDLPVAGIWANPPIRIGKTGLHTLLTRWFGQLTHGADAVMVVQRHLGADSLQRWLTNTGYPTTRVLSKSGFRLLHSTRPPHPTS